MLPSAILYSPEVDIYLVDTPGFDDTERSDTDVLKEIATWLTRTYANNIQLSGIIYLHRITDPRIQGSARKNLFMFKKLCGTEVLQNVLLVSTMWENVEESDGIRRESELTNTPEFWGVMVQNGAEVMSIQKEMVHENKRLDETEAGMELETEFRKEREKFKKDLAEAQEMMKQALEARDQESEDILRKYQDDTSTKIQMLIQEREKLKITMEQLHREKFAQLESEYKKQGDLFQQREEKSRRREKQLTQQMEEQRRLMHSLVIPIGLSGGHEEPCRKQEMQNATEKYKFQNLPAQIRARAGNLDQVKRVYLGYGDAYVIQGGNGEILYNLHGHYEGLAEYLKKYKVIKDLALNISDPSSYIIVSSQGECGWNTRQTGKTFDVFKFREYMTKNFGTKWLVEPDME
ncbi:hypothetical protein DL770_005263 [Monosporascus sp. CRB-9-2]|nr:hypothetical protein DL770_005263 [Monosporascus sp. CRB-9-2]